MKRMVSLLLIIILFIGIIPEASPLASAEGGVYLSYGTTYVFENTGGDDATVCAMGSVSPNSRADWVVLKADGSLKECNNCAYICYLADKEYTLSSGEKMIMRPQKDEGICFSWSGGISRSVVSTPPVTRYLLRKGVSYSFANSEAYPQIFYLSGDVNYCSLSSANIYADFVMMDSSGWYKQIGCGNAVAFLSNVPITVEPGEKYIIKPLRDYTSNDYVVAFTVNYPSESSLSLQVTEAPVRRIPLKKGVPYRIENLTDLYLPFYFSGSSGGADVSINAKADYAVYDSNGELVSESTGDYVSFLKDSLKVINPGWYWEVTPVSDYTSKDYIVTFTPYNVTQSELKVTCLAPELIVVEAGKYMFHVVDEDGEPLAGAEVQYNGQTGMSDDSGNVLFDLEAFGTPSITVTKDGYLSWSNRSSYWQPDPNRYEIVILYKTESGQYKLNLAYYSNTPILPNGNSASPVTNVLAYTKTLSLSGKSAFDLDFGNFYFLCLANDSTQVTTYQLWQNQKLIASSDTGVFSKLNVDSFSKGGGCFVRVVSNDGKQVDTNVNLVFAENKINKETAFSLKGKGFSFQVSDDIPFIGGSTLKFDLPIADLPVNWSIGEDKTKIAINLALDEGKPVDEQLDTYKKMLAKASHYSNISLSKHDATTLKNLVKNNNKADFFKSCTLTFAAYFEQSNGSKSAEGYIALLAKADLVEFEYNTVVAVVPVTVQIGVDFTMEIGAIGKYNAESGTISGNLMLNPTIGLKAFGGVGVSKFVGVGAYGSADLAVKYNLIGTEQGLRNVDLTGELGLKAYAGPLTYQKPFAHQTWHLYTANTIDGVSIDELTQVWSDELFDAAQYEPTDLNYLSRESDWLGEVDAELPHRAALSEGIKTEFSPLLTDTYRNANPVMVSDGENLYAAFVRADQETERRYVALTKFDGVQWAEPVRVSPESILDDAPALCVDKNGTIWLAYAKTAVDPGESLLTYAANQEIVVGTIHPQTLAFTEKRVYSGQSYAHLHQLGIVNGNACLTWENSVVTDDNSVLRPQSGTILFAACVGSVWSDAEEIASVETQIDSITLGDSDGQAVVGYISNETLYRVFSGEEPEIIAENVTGNVAYGLIPGTEEASFLWNSEGSLVSASGASVQAAGISHEYALAGNRIYYSMASEEGANLAVLQYDAGNWSLPMQLTGDSRYLENLSVAGLHGRDYAFGMHTAVSIDESGIEDAKNLVWAEVSAVSDLRLDSAVYNDENLINGENVPVMLTVTNAGDHTVERIDLRIDETPDRTVSCSLEPGSSMEIETGVVCTDVLTSHCFFVCENGKEDYNPADNSFEIGLGYADVKTELRYEQIGEGKALVAAVTNVGLASADGTVTFWAEGAALGTGSFSKLAAGDTAIIQFGLDPKAAEAGGDISVSVSLTQDEQNLQNNSDAVFITAPFKNPFTDVKEGKYYYDAVLWAYYHDPQIASGATPDTFGVKNPCTREQIVTFLWNACGAPEPVTTENPFIDVKEGKYYYKAVLWAVENGITTGSTPTTFGVKKTCNRGDVMTFLWKAAGSPEPETTENPFEDVKPSKYYYKPVLWAVENGITTGTSATTFGPKVTCTRAQIVTFLYAAYGDG